MSKISQKVTYSQFKQAKVKWDTLGGNIIDIPKEKTKYKPKIWVQSQLITEYLIERDRILYKMFPNSRDEILSKYGKTRPNGDV